MEGCSRDSLAPKAPSPGQAPSSGQPACPHWRTQVRAVPEPEEAHSALKLQDEGTNAQALSPRDGEANWNQSQFKTRASQVQYFRAAAHAWGKDTR